MKQKIFIFLLTVLSILATTACARNDVTNVVTDVTELTTPTTISRVVTIKREGQDNEVKELSLSPSGWEEFLKSSLLGEGVSLTMDIHGIFDFNEVEISYTEDILEFLQKDRKYSPDFKSQFEDNYELFLLDRFHNFFTSYKTPSSASIEVYLEAKDLGQEYVMFNIIGSNAKRVQYRNKESVYGKEFLIFTKNEKLYALNHDLRMFQLIPKTI